MSLKGFNTAPDSLNEVLTGLGKALNGLVKVLG